MDKCAINEVRYQARDILPIKTLLYDVCLLLQVTYNLEGFLDKNRDLLYKDLSKAMYACERGMLQELFPEGNLELNTLKRPPTAGYQLRNSVNQLMKNLLTKNPNYIRCIKVRAANTLHAFVHLKTCWLSLYFCLIMPQTNGAMLCIKSYFYRKFFRSIFIYLYIDMYSNTGTYHTLTMYHYYVLCIVLCSLMIRSRRSYSMSPSSSIRCHTSASTRMSVWGGRGLLIGRSTAKLSQGTDNLHQSMIMIIQYGDLNINWCPGKPH